MQIISSKENEMIKNIKKLKDKKYRDLNNEFIIEGIKLIKEAIEEDVQIKKVVVCEECVQDGAIEPKLLYEIAKYDCLYVTKNVYLTLTDVKNPQGILAVIEKGNSEDDIDLEADFIVALDDLQDPGNLGTILRTLDSADIKQVIVSKGTADPYNPKVVRSTMGAIFRVKVIECEDLVTTLKNLKKNKFKIQATSLQTENSIYDVNYKKKVLVIGNEANGVSNEILNLADEKIKIPMLGKTESLNAAVATSIVVYEYVRRKITK